MLEPVISISRRTRKTPFTAKVKAAGVSGYTVYNHMLLPTYFESVEADYHHLKTHVQVWDVACERQVEISGPDAFRLCQLLTPRDLSRMQRDQCFYIPVVDESGGMLNDPVLLRIEDDRYWVSIADSDLILWAKGVAIGMKLDVRVHEPEVAPLGVQGPKSEKLMSRVFGDEVRDIRFFRHKKLEFLGIEVLVARSGYSKQGGFEIYVEGRDYAEPLWDALMLAGEDLQVRAGCPNLIERIEGGLLSYGNDMTPLDNPYECGLGKYCKPEVIECIGRDALIAISAAPLQRQLKGLMIDGEAIPPCRHPWRLRTGENTVGQVTSAIWSPYLQNNIAIAMIDASHSELGTVLQVETTQGTRDAVVCDLPFI